MGSNATVAMNVEIMSLSLASTCRCGLLSIHRPDLAWLSSDLVYRVVLVLEITFILRVVLALVIGCLFRSKLPLHDGPEEHHRAKGGDLGACLTGQNSQQRRLGD